MREEAGVDDVSSSSELKRVFVVDLDDRAVELKVLGRVNRIWGARSSSSSTDSIKSIVVDSSESEGYYSQTATVRGIGECRSASQVDG